MHCRKECPKGVLPTPLSLHLNIFHNLIFRLSPPLGKIFFIDGFLCPPVHTARWAHMHRFPSVCLSVHRHLTKILGLTYLDLGRAVICLLEQRWTSKLSIPACSCQARLLEGQYLLLVHQCRSVLVSLVSSGHVLGSKGPVLMQVHLRSSCSA